MIVHTAYGRILLVTHALQRFEQRTGIREPAELVEAVRGAKVQVSPPAWTSVRSAREHESNAAWLVGSRWACPLRLPVASDRNRGAFDFAAVTCVTRKQRSKAEVRAWRELVREEWAA